MIDVTADAGDDADQFAFSHPWNDGTRSSSKIPIWRGLDGALSAEPVGPQGRGQLTVADSIALTVLATAGYKDRSTSLATHLVHPRASPSRRAVCWAQSSYGLSRLPCLFAGRNGCKSLALIEQTELIHRVQGCGWVRNWSVP